MPNNLISEDRLVHWVKSHGGALHTRKYSNINNMDLSDVTLVCLTGYENIIQTFFAKIIQNFNTPIILITVETDGFDMKKEYLEHDKIKHWFMWNKPFGHPKLTCIPIGLNFDRQSNSLNRWLSSGTQHARDKNLLINFSKHTHSSRGVLLKKARQEWSSFCDMIQPMPAIETKYINSIIEGKLMVYTTDPSFYHLLARYKFILSPRGVGLDCHRTWEALYVGTIPIVLSSSIDSIYEGLPVVIVKSWDEVTESFLERKYEELLSKKCDISKMFMDYWTSRINDVRHDRKIHFITYANDKFKDAKKRIVEEANNFGEFSSVTGLGPEDLSMEFSSKFNDVLSQPRGAGFWAWRPHILKEALDKINTGEFLVYLDAGCKLNPQGKKRFNEYIDLLDKSEYGFLSFSMSGGAGPGSLEPERNFNVKEVFKYFSVSMESEVAKSGQYLGGVLIIQKNEHAMFIVDLFLKALEDDPLMFSDHYNTEYQESYFRDNRHDQSISSMIRKIHGSVVIDGDESWMQPFGKGESLKYPFWATRSRE
jgi:hypothetical protein